MKHYHYTIIGYDEESRDKKTEQVTLHYMTTIEVLSDNEKDAIAKAKKLLKKKKHFIKEVKECHESENDPELAMRMHMAQIEIQKKMLDIVKGQI